MTRNTKRSRDRNGAAPLDACALAAATFALLLGIVGAGVRAVRSEPWSQPSLGSSERVLAAPGVDVPSRASSAAARARATADGGSSARVLGVRVPATGPPRTGTLPVGDSGRPERSGSQWRPDPRPSQGSVGGDRPVDQQTGPQTPAPVPAPSPSSTITPPPNPTPAPSPSQPARPSPSPSTPFAPGPSGDGEDGGDGGDKSKNKSKGNAYGLDKGKGAAPDKGGKDD